MKKALTAITLALMVSLTGCDNKQGKTETVAVPETVAAPQVQNGRQGKVVEFSHVPGYTYALVENSGAQQWFAGPTSELEVGETVYWNPGAVMNSFNSKALGKTFESITFIDGYLDQPSRAAPKRAVAAAPSAPRGEVLSTQTAAGYLYLEIKSATGNVWVAAPMADIKVGDQVEWSGASLMRNFSSKSLGRSFAEIYFAASVAKVN